MSVDQLAIATRALKKYQQHDTWAGEDNGIATRALERLGKVKP